jgi:hypothetical protein
MRRTWLVSLALFALAACERESPIAPTAAYLEPSGPGFAATIPVGAREVNIDFKPALGSDESFGYDVLSRRKKGTVTVALLGALEADGVPAFDVATVDASGVVFGHDDSHMAAPKHDFSGDDVWLEHMVEVNGDEITDLLFHFVATDLGLGGLGGSAEFCLIGVADGAPFYGCVEVQIVG